MIKARNCPACDSTFFAKQPAQFAPFITFTVYPAVKNTTACTCNDCGTIFALQRFEAFEMKQIYGDYRSGEYNARREEHEPGYTKMAKLFDHPVELAARHNAMNNFLCDQNVVPKRILDYGGDRGQFIPAIFPFAEKFVFEVSGVKAIDGVKNLKKIATLKTTEKFDLVLCLNVLEHLPAPIEAVRWLRKACGGYVFIDVPFDLERGRQNVFHEHITFFTSEGLAELVERVGFKVVKTEIVTIDSPRKKSSSLFLLAEI